MKVFITGGTGFIGANVVRAHLARGDQVRCLVRASSPSLTLDGLPVEKVTSSLRDLDALTRAVEGCDAVQHVAGVFDTGPEGAAHMREVHVDATRALVEVCKRLGIRRMVLCSSSITVGWDSLKHPGDEDTPIPDEARFFPPGTPTGAYLETKRAAERIALEALQQGVEVPVVNPDYVIGPWDLKPTSGAMIVHMARAPIPFYPRGGKCFIDAGDCAMGHLLALERGQPGRRYLLGTENLSYREFMTMVAEVVGSSPPLLPFPRSAIRAIGTAGALYARLNPHGAAGFDQGILRGMQEGRYRSGARARQELGLPHTPLRDSIESAWRWFRDHGYIHENAWSRSLRRFLG